RSDLAIMVDLAERLGFKKQFIHSVRGDWKGVPASMKDVKELPEQTVEDVLEFLFVGARAVQLGTVNFRDPTAADRIVRELAAFLAERGLPSVDAWVGRVAQVVSGTPVHWGS
ncbi:MAG: hypothetical protein NZ742_12235, partial [Acidobacteria bacterium]|nr:hypothetical protein [Acidobacteriota bacterium]MDW7985446.1 hypothetical protein [Acidobacteriota bacterium]